jgi:hypothetical protein
MGLQKHLLRLMRLLMMISLIILHLQTEEILLKAQNLLRIMEKNLIQILMQNHLNQILQKIMIQLMNYLHHQKLI